MRVSRWCWVALGLFLAPPATVVTVSLAYSQNPLPAVVLALPLLLAGVFAWRFRHRRAALQVLVCGVTLSGLVIATTLAWTVRRISTNLDAIEAGPPSRGVGLAPDLSPLVQLVGNIGVGLLAFLGGFVAFLLAVCLSALLAHAFTPRSGRPN